MAMGAHPAQAACSGAKIARHKTSARRIGYIPVSFSTSMQLASGHFNVE
jgi:hypothetical protein